MQGKKLDFESDVYINEIKERLFKNRIIDCKGCWNWTGCKKKFDYGVIRAKGKNNLVHRLSFEIFTGIKPEKKYVCHKCDNPSCFNPDHLFLGTQIENMKDTRVKKRMVSGESHYIRKLSEENVNEIRILLKNGIKNARIAEIYNVSSSNISYISSNKIWKNSLGGLSEL